MLDTSARRHCWRLAWRTRRRRCGSTLLRARAWRHRRSSRGEAQLSTRSVAKGVRYELRQQNAGSSRRKAQPPHPNSLARSGAQRRATPRGEPQQTDEARGWRMKYFKGLGTWQTSDAKQLLRDASIVRFVDDDEADAAVNLAFHGGTRT